MKASTSLFALLLAGCTGEHVKAPPAAPPAPAPAPAAAPAAAASEPTPTGTSVAAAVASSAEPPVAGPPAATAVSVSWSTWKSSGGEQPNKDCKKESSKELCYDAVDNNCDGELDEGCPGYQNTGNVMQFTIAWKSAVDLDLHVVGPDGKEVSAKVRDNGSLVLDKDCAGKKDGVDDCPQGKIENVFHAANRSVLRGKYRVWVELADTRGQKEAQVPFFFGGKVGAQTFMVPFFVPNKKGEKKSFEFDVL